MAFELLELSARTILVGIGLFVPGFFLNLAVNAKKKVGRIEAVASSFIFSLFVPLGVYLANVFLSVPVAFPTVATAVLGLSVLGLVVYFLHR